MLWLRKLLGMPVRVVMFEHCVPRHVQYGDVNIAEEWIGHLNSMSRDRRAVFLEFVSQDSAVLEDLNWADEFWIGPGEQKFIQRWVLGIPLS